MRRQHRESTRGKTKSIRKNFSLIADLTPKNMEEAKNRLDSRLKQLSENIDISAWNKK